MTNETSTVTIHMVSSLDGYIAKPGGDVSWMQSTDTYDAGTELTETYIAEFLQSIDCYVMGSRTYEKALELGWPYGDTPVFVVTQRTLPVSKDSVSYYSGNLETLVNHKLKPAYQNIWMVGGAALTRSLLQQGLADELVVTIVPVLLGEGLPYFDQVGVEQALHLKEITPFRDGMVELHYTLVRE